MTVEELVNAGYTVKVVHLRYPKEVDWSEDMYMQTRSQLKKMGLSPAPRGGKTLVRISKGDRDYVAEAVCSMKDNYSRKLGRMIALGRAMKAIKDFEMIPKEVWDESKVDIYAG